MLLIYKPLNMHNYCISLLLLSARIKVFTPFQDFKQTVLFVAYFARIVLKIKIFSIMIHHFECIMSGLYIYCCKLMFRVKKVHNEKLIQKEVLTTEEGGRLKLGLYEKLIGKEVLTADILALPLNLDTFY